MQCFEERFIKSKGKPIEHDGKTLVLADRFELNGARQVRLTIESFNSNWRQGIALKCDKPFCYDGKQFDGVAGLVFWQDSSPDSMRLSVEEGGTSIRVYNTWDKGDGVIHARHNNAAMIVEELPNGRRYRCNDGFADDDFDDIVFRLEQVDP